MDQSVDFAEQLIPTSKNGTVGKQGAQHRAYTRMPKPHITVCFMLHHSSLRARGRFLRRQEFVCSEVV